MRPMSTGRRPSSVKSLLTKPFITSCENRLGVGKLLNRDGEKAVVGYFNSPADTEFTIVNVHTKSLKRVSLPPQTRVYFEDPESMAWAIGRILDHQPDDGMYLVRFPNGDSRMIAEDHLQVRWAKPIDDPTDLLASQLNETPYWHGGRIQFIDSVFMQRRDCQGMTALLSSSIELVKHQASVVQRVLHDPFQRYLLADEVGLGKTIEAGILIRQLVLDEPHDHRVLVIVPDVIRSQWNQELRHRFHLDDELDGTIQIIGHRDAGAIAELGPKARMIVVDEAHHVAAWAWSNDINLRRVYEALSDATALPERRLLLLSGTPVLHNERAFLAMLHLLDPVVYSLDDVELFRKRVEHRQEVAESLLSLAEDEANYFLKDAIGDLLQFFQQDDHFKQLAARLLKLIDQDVDENDATRLELIRALRSHVSETWRLHRRLLRNRRTESTACYVPGRSGYATVSWDSNDVTAIDQLLRQWRLLFSKSLYQSHDEDKRRTIVELIRTFEQAAACDPDVLSNLAAVRLSDDPPLPDLPDSELASVTRPILVEGEQLLLRQIIDVSSGRRETSRMRAALKSIEKERESNDSSIVVFTNYTTTADRLYTYLVGRLGSDVVLRHRTATSDWTRFHQANRGLVLVCDRTAEEGLNLQNRRSVAIHYDLPFSINRIEQRLGRLDRFGAGRAVCSIVLSPDQHVTLKSWVRLVGDAFQVFGRSVASLQYVIEEQLERVWNEFLDAGPDAFDDAFHKLAGDDGIIETEFRKIRAQDEIDSFDEDVLSDETFERLEMMDLDASKTAKSVLNKWLVSRLHFRESGEEGRVDDVVRYQFTRRDDMRNRGLDTLVPYPDFQERFSNAIDHGAITEPPVVAETFPFAFNRQTAQRRLTRIARVGDTLVDAIENYIRWDDRGVCFAMWRYRPDFKCESKAEIAFRLDCIIEADSVVLRELTIAWPAASLQALQRRAGGVFSPIATTIWLNSDLEPLELTEKSQFEEVYRNKPLRGHKNLGRDFNLNTKRWIEVARFMDISFWDRRCVEVRQRAETILREQSQLLKYIDAGTARACVQCDTRIAQYRSRLSLRSGTPADDITRDLDFEIAFKDALLRSISQPSLRVDSIGAVFLSPHNPFEVEESDEDDE